MWNKKGVLFGTTLPSISCTVKGTLSSFCFFAILSYIGPARSRENILYVQYYIVTEQVDPDYISMHWLCNNMLSRHADSCLNRQGNVLDFRIVKLRIIIVYMIINLYIPHTMYYIIYIVYFILYTIYYILYTIYFIPYIYTKNILFI